MAISLLNGILWDKEIAKKQKVKFTNSITRSEISYGSEIQ